MKTRIYYFLTLSTTLFACHQSVSTINSSQNAIIANQEAVNQNSCIAQSDAENILGQAAKLTESAAEDKNGVTKSRCTYTATTVDTKTGKTGNLYYMLEDFENVVSAQKAYYGVLKQNEDMSGLRTLKEIGDQAFLHTDNENFVMIISRKGDKMLRLKVNRITSMTSPEALERISGTLTAKL